MWLENTSGHYGVANSQALSLAKITAATAQPVSGVIVRDEQGNATGELKESAQDVIHRLIPPYSAEQRRQALQHMIAVGHAEGMTGFKDPGISHEDWEAYKALDGEGALSAYVCVLFATPATWEGAQATLAQIHSAQRDIKGSPRTPSKACARA